MVIKDFECLFSEAYETSDVENNIPKSMQKYLHKKHAGFQQYTWELLL